MTMISIARHLWFEETELGATLNYRSDQTPEGILFRVGISYESLERCNDALMGQFCLWTIRDGSLMIAGDREELTLSFSAAQGQLYQAGVSLYGEELVAFKTAIHAFSCRPQTALN